MATSAQPESSEVSTPDEFSRLAELVQLVHQELPRQRMLLSEKVAQRSYSMAHLLGLDDLTCERIRVAGRIHRVGELFLSADFLDKNYLQMSKQEICTYRSYPIFSALRVSKDVSSEVYGILLNHREYCSGFGFLCADNDVPLGARILCLATEYEELCMYYGGDAHQEDVVLRRMMKNTLGRYDERAIKALLLSVAREHTIH